MNTKYCRQKGMSLIELMITVAIIGIIATVALGSYEQYQRRAKVSVIADEFLTIIDQHKIRIERGRFPGWASGRYLPPGPKLLEQYGTYYFWFTNEQTWGATGINDFKLPREDIEILDEIIDDGDPTTGKLRLDFSGRPIYLTYREFPEEY